MPSFNSVMKGSSLSDFGDISSKINPSKMVNDKLGGLKNEAKKHGIDIPNIPKFNIPDFGIKKTIDGATKDMSGAFDKMNREMGSINMTDISQIEKSTGINMDMADFNTDLTKISFD